MLGLKVYLYDKTVPTESREDIQELVSFLTAFLRLHDKHPGRAQDYQETLPLEFVPSVSVRKMSEWLQMAWETLDEDVQLFGATGDEIYNALTSLGFESTANNPKAAVKASVRLGGQFFKIGVNKNKEAVWSLKEKISKPTVKPPRFSLDDPRRQSSKPKVVDFAVRALNELGGQANKEDLAVKMVEYGWNTKSDDRPGIVAATLRKYQEFEKQGDLWSYSQAYKAQIEYAE